MKIKSCNNLFFARWNILVFWICAVFFTFGAGYFCFSQTAAVSDNITAAQQYYDKGKEYLNQEDFQKADESFKQAELILDSGKETAGSKALDGQPATLKTGNLQEQAKAPVLKDEDKGQTAGLDTDQAISRYQRSLKSDKRNSKVYYYDLGVLYARKNDYLNAAKMFNKAISLDRDDYEAYYNLGAIYETIFFNRQKAIECYQMYLKFAPSGKEKETVSNWLDYVKMQ